MVDDDEPPFTHHLKVRRYSGIEKVLDRHNELLATIAAQAAELEALRGEVGRTLTDTQRLLWCDDVAGICPSLESCFEYGDTVRCAPCAIKQSQAQGVEPNIGLPNLPEVSRLRRESASKDATISQLRARVAALEEGVTRLERANEALCAKRTHRTYLSMIDIDRCKDELLELDLAREEARALLNQNGEEG